MLHVGFVGILYPGQDDTLSLVSPCRPPHMPTLAWAFSQAHERQRTARQLCPCRPPRRFLRAAAPLASSNTNHPWRDD